MRVDVDRDRRPGGDRVVRHLVGTWHDRDRDCQAKAGTPLGFAFRDQGTTLVAARPVVVRSEGYLGSESCKKCHEDYYQSWHASYHRTMTQPITPATAPAAIIDGSVRGGGADVPVQPSQR